MLGNPMSQDTLGSFQELKMASGCWPARNSGLPFYSCKEINSDNTISKSGGGCFPRQASHGTSAPGDT